MPVLEDALVLVVSVIIFISSRRIGDRIQIEAAPGFLEAPAHVRGFLCSSPLDVFWNGARARLLSVVADVPLGQQREVRLGT
jgi:hypothetical protein